MGKDLFNTEAVMLEDPEYQSFPIDILKEINNTLIVSDELYRKTFESSDREMDLSYIIGYLRGTLLSVKSELEGI